MISRCKYILPVTSQAQAIFHAFLQAQWGMNTLRYSSHCGLLSCGTV
jgi:hypothetical protein